jgi:hypothetical protein
LESVLESGAIDFVKNVWSDLDVVVRSDSEKIVVERTVMDSAHRDTIWHYWLAAIGILLDVGGVEEFRMSQSA